MKKKLFVLFLITVFAMTIGLSSCSKEEPSDVPEDTSEEAEAIGAKYGYTGDDPIEAAVYAYLAGEVSKNYDPADVSIPTVDIFAADFSDDDDILVYGDYSVDNYNIEDKTLVRVSGGHYPGVMHVSSDNVVTAFDQVADGSDFDASAEELFGEYYEDFKEVYADSDAREKLRRATIADYVRLNLLEVGYFQDEGSEPVPLDH